MTVCSMKTSKISYYFDQSILSIYYFIASFTISIKLVGFCVVS